MSEGRPVITAANRLMHSLLSSFFQKQVCVVERNCGPKCFFVAFLHLMYYNRSDSKCSYYQYGRPEGHRVVYIGTWGAEAPLLSSHPRLTPPQQGGP